MSYRKYPPPEIFRNLIHFFWEYEDDFTASNAYHQPTTASINPKLAFQYKGQMHIKSRSGQNEVLFRSGFQAQTDTFNTIFTNQSVGIFGVYFCPTAIQILFGIPATEITNYNIEIAELLGLEGKELEEKIMLSKSTAERINILSNFLQKKLKQLTFEEQLINATLVKVIEKKGTVRLNELTSYLYLSPKQVERKFQKFTGFNPKQFARIVRFEQSISSFYQGVQSLTTLAHEMGFYDQSHFIKNFSTFSGQHPTAYFANDLSQFVNS